MSFSAFSASWTTKVTSFPGVRALNFTLSLFFFTKMAEKEVKNIRRISKEKSRHTLSVLAIGQGEELFDFGNLLRLRTKD